MVVVLLLQPFGIFCLSVRQHPGRVAMSQQQSCYYQPHSKELVCQCREGEDKSYLHLRLREFIIQAGQEVRLFCVACFLWWLSCLCVAIPIFGGGCGFKVRHAATCTINGVSTPKCVIYYIRGEYFYFCCSNSTHNKNGLAADFGRKTAELNTCYFQIL